jgi:2-polyprenyl-3-methyl-5-hydroxy-6-metoxy-1,4-benzoquinol methylase
MKMFTLPQHPLNIVSRAGQICPVCSVVMTPVAGAYVMCNECRYMMSHDRPGAGAEVESLDPVREKNFIHILETLQTQFTGYKTILDVGSSRGVFLKLAAAGGFWVTGLEPDACLAEQCRSEGFEVITAFFPGTEALGAKTFDVIIFNDSFEHIPDPSAVIAGIKKHLNPQGTVIINLPDSAGLLFQAAFFLYKLGITAPFDRLWQKGFASPHLHYFNPANLQLLFEKHGFTRRKSAPLSFYLITGLWRRIRCKSSLAMSVITWLALAALYPLFAIKSDCFVSYFSLKGADGI